MVGSPRPLILIRGFGGPGVSDERRDAYQGFNNGSVYAERYGENYIYEGFVLRALKSRLHPYRDATNVVGYYEKEQKPRPGEHDGWPEHLLTGTMVVDVPMAREVLGQGALGTLWIYRYYDLLPRKIDRFGKGWSGSSRSSGTACARTRSSPVWTSSRTAWAGSSPGPP